MQIDELVVALKLDPTQFTEEQKRAVDNLRGMEQAAILSSERIEQAMRSGMNAFWGEFNAKLTGSSDKLEHVGDQSRRSGEKIAAAGERGAQGFKGLTSSLLEAYAVVGTLEGAFHKLEQGAQRATATTIASMTTGIGTRELGGLAGAFPFVPTEQSYGFFQQIASWQALWRAGKPPQGVIDALNRYGAGMAGVGTDFGRISDVPYMLGQFSKIIHGLDPGSRYAFMQQIGMPAGMLPEMMKDPAQVVRDTIEAMNRAPTAKVTEEVTNLNEATRKAEQSWLTLWETVEASAAEHGGTEAMGALDQGLQKLNRWMGTTTQGAGVLKDVLTGLAILIGVNMVRAVARLLAVLTGAVLPPWLAGLIAAYETMKPSPLNQGEEEWLKKHPPGPNTHWDEGSKSWVSGAAVGGPAIPGGSLSAAIHGGGADAIADYITRREGGSPAGVVNNPGNIKFTGAPGQIDSGVRARDGGTFASYATPEAGRAAIIALINRAASGSSRAYGPNPTVGSFLNTYSGGGYGLSTAARGVAASGGGIDVGHLSRVTGLTAARAAAGAIVNNIGSVVVNTQATDAKTIAKDVKSALDRELKSRSSSQVMQNNTVFETIALFIVFGMLAASFIMTLHQIA